MTIYFDENKRPSNTRPETCICEIEDIKWAFYSQYPDTWDIIDGVFTDLRDTEEYKAKQKQKERERLDNLKMTRGDVFEALILAKGLAKPQIRAMIENAELDDITKALYLNRFDEALDFYRGFPVFDMLGQALGVTSEQLDNFFITKNYEFLKVVEVPAEETSNDDVANEGETSQNEGE